MKAKGEHTKNPENHGYFSKIKLFAQTIKLILSFVNKKNIIFRTAAQYIHQTLLLENLVVM